MRKLFIFIAALAAFGGGLYWFLTRPPGPKEVDFTKVKRERLLSVVTTNAKVEPVEFAAVRSEMEGPIAKLSVEKGDRVSAGQTLAELETSTVRAELAAAEARVAQAASDVQVYLFGGAKSQIAEIENGLIKLRDDLSVAKKQAASIEKLVARNAEPRQDLVNAQNRVRQIELEGEALERRRATLLPPGGREAAEARLRDANSALALAKRRIEQTAIKSPLAGVVYNLPVKKGGYVHAGDLVAEVGRTETLRALVYVDEPEWGRVAIGMPVKLTWEAMAGKQWDGKVEKMPSQVMALGTRQVGEVVCRIGNGDGLLPPGANVQAEILSKVAENALTIPRSTLRREGTELGVFALNANKVEWRPLRLGISSVTSSEVLEGLKEGDAVALATEIPLKTGEPVIPRFP